MSDKKDKPEIHERKPIRDLDMQDYTRYLPTAFDESLSILEKMNKMIWKLNKLGELTNDMLDRWNEVIEWVLEDGLQQAVLDQLEEWLEDGTIKDLINKEIFQELRDDLDDLQKEVDEKLDKKLDMEGYYDEHSVTYHRDDKSETTYVLMKIPQKDKHGDTIRIKVTDDNDASDKRKVTEFAEMKQATAMINASPGSGSSNSKRKTTIINDGDIRRKDKDMEERNFIIGIKENNTMKSFAPNTSPQEMKDDGYVTAIPAFIPLLEDGDDVSESYTDLLDNATDPHPRTVLAQDSSKNTYFFTSEGRLMGEYGMKTKDVVRVLKKHNMEWAHMLDGGGSTTMVNYHQVIHRMSGAESGDRGATERTVRNALYIGKDKVNKTATKLLAHVGNANTSVFRHNQYLEALRYQKNNYIPLADYFVNGWEASTTAGDNTPRAWVLPNNTLYLRGVVTAGKKADVEDTTTFIELPKEIPPMFDTHHLVAGDKKGEIYKVVIEQDGKMTWYFWNENFSRHDADDDDFEYYIRLDGIYIPLNYTSNDDDLTRTQGIQQGWTPHGLD